MTTTPSTIDEFVRQLVADEKDMYDEFLLRNIVGLEALWRAFVYYTKERNHTLMSGPKYSKKEVDEQHYAGGKFVPRFEAMIDISELVAHHETEHELTCLKIGELRSREGVEPWLMKDFKLYFMRKEGEVMGTEYIKFEPPSSLKDRFTIKVYADSEIGWYRRRLANLGICREVEVKKTTANNSIKIIVHQIPSERIFTDIDYGGPPLGRGLSFEEIQQFYNTIPFQQIGRMKDAFMVAIRFFEMYEKLISAYSGLQNAQRSLQEISRYFAELDPPPLVPYPDIIQAG